MGVAHGNTAAVDVGCRAGVGVGSGVTVGFGVVVGAGVAVGAGVGVSVGSGPTRTDEAPAVIASCFCKSRRTPEKSYCLSAAGGRHGVGHQFHPQQGEGDGLSLHLHGGCVQVGCHKGEPLRQGLLEHAEAAVPRGKTVTRSSPSGSTHGAENDRVAPCVDATAVSGCRGKKAPSTIAPKNPSRTYVLTDKALSPCRGDAGPQQCRGLPSPDIV